MGEQYGSESLVSAVALVLSHLVILIFCIMLFGLASNFVVTSTAHVQTECYEQSMLVKIVMEPDRTHIGDHHNMDIPYQEGIAVCCLQCYFSTTVFIFHCNTDYVVLVLLQTSLRHYSCTN